jgi:hypothetical protein
VPNKYAFKKLVQKIVSSVNYLTDADTPTTKIEEIKTKVKEITKNNGIVNMELDYFFDQRLSNMQSSYEKITLLDSKLSNNPNHQTSSNQFTLDAEKSSFSTWNSSFNRLDLQRETIDLTNQYSFNFGTKKCTCACHKIQIRNSLTNLNTKTGNESSNTNETNLNKITFGSQNTQLQIGNLQSAHCLLCSLKLIKNKLCIKCEGKKARPIVTSLALFS